MNDSAPPRAGDDSTNETKCHADIQHHTPQQQRRPLPDGWAYEGIACYVAPAGSAALGWVPLYRAWNGNDHFYTASDVEYNSLPSNYKKEGVACLVQPSKTGNNVPFYRLYHSGADDHLYTASEVEKTSLSASGTGWQYEGIAGYVEVTAAPGLVPLYRAYHFKIVDHFYTTSDDELDVAAPQLSSSDLQDLLKHDLAGNLSDHIRIFTADGTFFPAMKQAADQIIEHAKIHKRVWTADVFDCDDFAHLFKAAFIEDQYTDRNIRTLPYAVGIAWGMTGSATNSSAHAMNVVVTVEQGTYKVWIVEPQSNIYYSPSDRKLFEIWYLVF